MAVVRRRSVRVALFCVALLIVCRLSCTICGATNALNVLGSFSKCLSEDTTKSLFLNEQQCRATFPGLTKEIDDAVARGPFILDKKPDDYQGLVQARIKDGKVRVQLLRRESMANFGGTFSST